MFSEVCTVAFFFGPDRALSFLLFGARCKIHAAYFGLVASCLLVTSTKSNIVARGYLAPSTHASLAPISDKAMPHTRGGDGGQSKAKAPRSET